jgi:hypothetical protein
MNMDLYKKKIIEYATLHNPANFEEVFAGLFFYFSS